MAGEAKIHTWKLALLLAMPGVACSADGLAAHEDASLATAGSSRIATMGLDSETALRTSQAVVGSTPGDYTLRNRDGQQVRLSSYRGKPLLVSFIYTGCFHICPMSTRALHKAVRSMRARFGDRQFDVVTIGFNQPEDSPEALRAYAMQQRITDSNWEFLSPDASDVEALSRDFGFTYLATPAGFDHTLQVTILDANGTVYRQIYGDSFTAAKLGEPLRELLTGTRIIAGNAGLMDLIDRVRILCSVYDPDTDTYRADYTLYLMIAGGITFFLSMLWFLLSELRERVLARRASGAG